MKIEWSQWYYPPESIPVLGEYIQVEVKDVYGGLTCRVEAIVTHVDDWFIRTTPEHKGRMIRWRRRVAGVETSIQQSMKEPA